MTAGGNNYQSSSFKYINSTLTCFVLSSYSCIKAFSPVIFQHMTQSLYPSWHWLFLPHLEGEWADQNNVSH